MVQEGTIVQMEAHKVITHLQGTNRHVSCMQEEVNHNLVETQQMPLLDKMQYLVGVKKLNNSTKQVLEDWNDFEGTLW